MKDKILILGKGFIGNRLQEELNCEASDKNISCYEDADALLKEVNPGVIINCIGYTGVNVDECEKNIEKTLTANSFIPVILAEAAIRNNIRLIHISSGCIYRYDYSKDTPIDESKKPDFFDLFYSRTKIYSERSLEILSKKYPVLIIRIRIPLDNRPHPKNLLTKLINYKRIIDTPNSVTYIPDFIDAIQHLIKINARGIFNIVNKGALSYPELMGIYRKYAPDFQYEVIDFKNLNNVRTNLVLSTEKLENSGFKIRNINEVLEGCVKGYLSI